MNNPRTYQRKPSFVQAIQWTGSNVDALIDWIGDSGIRLPQSNSVLEAGMPLSLYVHANGGWLDLEVGEWILRDDLGFYPCKDSQFSKVYEAVEPF